MTRVLIDLDVILDVLFQREPHYKEAAILFRRIESGDFSGYVAAHSVTTLYYLAAKRLGRAKCRELLIDVLQLFEVVPVDGDSLRHALGLGWKDFADAVQAACAEAAAADYLATRDKKGFRTAATRVLTPGELVALPAS
jgi:predicted nucleic acid-binding protein